METKLETVRRNLNTFVAIGVSAIALTGVELATAAEPVGADMNGSPIELKSSALPFKPGHYEGTTSQVCSTDAAAQGVCTEGQKIPVSFTATKSKIVKFASAAIDKCFDGANQTPDTVLPLVFSKPVTIFKGKGFVASQDLPGGILRKELAGNIKGNKAYGDLGSEAFLNPAGKPDINGNNACNSGPVHWQAKLVK